MTWTWDSAWVVIYSIAVAAFILAYAYVLA